MTKAGIGLYHESEGRQTTIEGHCVAAEYIKLGAGADRLSEKIKNSRENIINDAAIHARDQVRRDSGRTDLSSN